MTAIKSALAKSTIQAVVAFLLVATACVLAYQDRLKELFVGLVIYALIWAFGPRGADKPA